MSIRSSTARSAVPLLALALAAGCSGSPRDRVPDIARIYAEAALDEVRNPVVVVHGVLGARLERQTDGQVVWGAFTYDSADPGTPDGARAVALPLLEPGNDGYISDGVRASGPLDTINLELLFSVVEVEVYASILRTLGNGGYRDDIAASTDLRYADDHYTCHSFFYDWRQDNIANAGRFGRFLRETREKIDATAAAKIDRLRAAGDAATADRIQAWLDRGYKFDVVAHSMGGLMARWFLRYGEAGLGADGSPPALDWAGAAQIDRLVIVGAPNLGSMLALARLIEGFSPAAPLTPFYDQAILGTMPSLYQLLPRTRHGVLLDDAGNRSDADLLDPELWIENRWGILSPAVETTLAWLLPAVKDPDARRGRAVAYLRWCLARARAFHAGLDRRPETPCPAQLSLFAGGAEPTLTRARLVRDANDRLVPCFDGEHVFCPGDRAVPRYSAVADERMGAAPDPAGRRRFHGPIRWSSVTFLSDEHVGLTSNPVFVDNLLFQLLETPPGPPPAPGTATTGAALSPSAGR